jgi:LacI family transcriptional regulator
MVLMDVGNPFFTDVMSGAEDYISSLGHTVHIGNSGLDLNRESGHLDLFEQERVRGILLAPLYVSHRARDVRRRGIPVVLLDRAEDSSDCCTVSVDDVEGGRLAVEHLLALGHRRLAVVGGSSTLPQVRDRRLGAEVARGGAPGEDVDLLMMSTSAMDAESGTEAATQLALLPREERPTAVFAINDLLAIGLLQGFVTLGMRVPEDIALIGYDDITFAATAAVPLSSVRQPRRELGRRGAELLFEEIQAAESQQPHEHQQVRFSPELVIRRSTAGARPR